MLRIIPHAAVAWFALCTCATSSAAATEAADGVDAYGRTSRYVRMRDGTRIAVDVLLPPTLPGAKPQRRPTLFRYSPYRRVVVDPATGKVVLNPDVRFFLDHGYAVVQADMRGTGASEGWTNQMDLAIRRDGRELVDWIDRQRWSNHRVGMFGGSYEGWAQLAVAAERPRALKAIAPAAAGFDDMLNRPGGILSYAFMQNWSALTYHLNHGTTFPAMPMTPSPPVEDEDGDGTVQDEVPVDLNGNGWFHDDYAATSRHGPAVRYADGIARRRNTYLNAIKQHARDGDGYTLSNTMRFRDTSRPGDGATIADLTWAMVPAIRKSKVAILTIGGWFDPFVRAGTQIYSTLAPTNPSRLLIYPTYHQGLSPKFAAAIAAPDRQAVRDAQLQWFDHWLKGIDNGAERAPPVHVFQMNAGWRDAGSWPLPHATTRIYQLGAGRRLVEGGDPMPASQDLYRADFTASSGWGPMIDTTSIAAVNRRLGRAAPVSATFSRNRQQMLGAPADIPDRTAADAKALIYTSDPLAGDLDVIGHPVVHLTVGSTSDDADLFFYLEDVAPDGTATLVTEYQHRAGFSRLRDNRSTIPHNPGIVVAPQLPWHGYDRKDYDAAPFAGGRKVEIVSDLYPTAWRFRAGHRLRLSITCADWPTFELHPALSPSNRPDDPANIVPTITMELGGITMSRIELPIAPGA